MARTFKPDPQLTKGLRVSVDICAAVLRQGQDAVTEALTDPDTSTEMEKLVNDLVSLLGVIVEEAVPQATPSRALVERRRKPAAG